MSEKPKHATCDQQFVCGFCSTGGIVAESSKFFSHVPRVLVASNAIVAKDWVSVGSLAHFIRSRRRCLDTGRWRPFRGPVRRRCSCRRRGPGCRRRWCGRDVAEHDAAGGDFGADADLDVAEDLRAAPSSTPRRTFGWRSPRSLPVPPSVTSCRIETLSSTTAVSPMTTLVPWSMMMPAADAGGGMDVDAERLGDAILEVGGQAVSLVAPQPVGDAIGLERVKAFVVQERLGVAAGGGVAGAGGQEIGADRGADRRSSAKASLIRSRKRIAGTSGVCSLLARITLRPSSSVAWRSTAAYRKLDEHGLALGLLPGLGLDLFPEAVFGRAGQVFGEFVHGRVFS